MTDQTSISFQANGAPYSKQFDDIYFDTESGCQQSESVFIQGNDIASRLLSGPESFTIAETGFGTGLNFLLTLRVFRQVQQEFAHSPGKKLPKLTFISVEKYPLSKAQLIQSLAIWPELVDFTEALAEQYPEQFNANEYLLSFFDGKVTLKLYIGDAALALENIRGPKSGLVDAWYLDGFSPAKNPEMWSRELFAQIARLSKDQASLSTFTVAGFVKRQLNSVGFRLEKKPSQGKKKEILTGVYQQNKLIGKGYQLRPQIAKPQHVSIIGGGIASACAAYALTQKGVKVTLYCQDQEIAQGASSNAIGALYPLLHQQSDDISSFYQQAFWHAKNLYQSLLDQGYHFAHNWCGLLEVSYKETLEKRQQKFEQFNAWPKELIHGVDQEQASALAGIKLDNGGLFMPNAGWIAPQELVTQVFKAALDSKRLRIKTGVTVQRLEQTAKNKWNIHTSKGEFSASVLVVCGGAEAIKLNILDQLPLSSVRGQVTSMTTNNRISPLSTVLCHKGYLTPEHQGIHCIGATFDKDSFNIQSRDEDDQYNLAMLNKCLPELDVWQESDFCAAKARLRCATPDHLPLVGAMPDIEAHKAIYPHLAKDKNWRYFEPAPVVDNLYMLTGLGARGLCSAPLVADILAADICGTPYPVDSKVLFNLSPNRFVIRDIIKRKFIDKD